MQLLLFAITEGRRCSLLMYSSTLCLHSMLFVSLMCSLMYMWLFYFFLTTSHCVLVLLKLEVAQLLCALILFWDF